MYWSYVDEANLVHGSVREVSERSAPSLRAECGLSPPSLALQTHWCRNLTFVCSNSDKDLLGQGVLFLLNIYIAQYLWDHNRWRLLSVYASIALVFFLFFFCYHCFCCSCFFCFFLYSILSNLAFSNFCIRGDSTMAVHVTVSMVVSAILILNYYIRVWENKNLF